MIDVEANKPSKASEWEWVKLSDVTRIVSGATPASGESQFWGGEITWITPTDLGRLEIPDIHQSERQLTKEGYKSCSTEELPIGTVVMSSRAPIGHLGIARVSLCTNQGCKSFVPSSRIDSLFLFFTLRWLMPSIKALGSGSTFAEVSKTQLASFEIPLPPLETQRNIATKLEAQMKAVETARIAAEQQLKIARGLSRKFLSAAFEETEASGTERKPFSAALVEIQAGKSMQCVERPAQGDEWGVLRVSSVSWGEFDPDENKVLPVGYSPPIHHVVKEGDLLISRANTTELVGAVVRVPEIHSRLALSDKTLRLIPEEKIVSKDFLEFALREKIARNFIEENATGTSSSMKNISQEVIRQVPILLPSLEDQNRIVSKLKTELEGAQQLVQSLEEQLETINAMPAALLREAFSGRI
jgi:type I restriction enzyme, S subunit